MKSLLKLIAIFAAVATGGVDTCGTPYTYNQSDVTVNIYTQNNPDNPDVIPLGGSLDTTHFNVSNKCFVIIHGWTNNATSPVNILIKDALLNKNNLNIFVIGWVPASNVDYFYAQSAVVPIGNEVANFFNSVMTQYNITAENFEMAGHSLGAHMCGVIGSSLGGAVSSIIGMDPAGPCYTEMNTADRIDPSDALFVEIIHTNAGVFGINFNCGHADFYPNGGTQQPGCISNVLISLSSITNETVLKQDVFCSHIRSFEYTADSIKTDTGYTSTLCQSMTEYSTGMCANNIKSYLGRYIVNRIAGEFYLTTNGAPPYSKN